ncbi:MAG: hypothetical protein IKV62_02875 [Bacteroidales bacterium]|nr:hypothetical protein [Bacteroidales bacterium]
MKKILLGLVCLLSLVACNKGPISYFYVYGVVVDCTDPSEIADTGMRDEYTTILNNILGDLAPGYLFSNTKNISVIKDQVGVDIDPEKLPEEDEKMIEKFNNYLPEIKGIEDKYRDRIEDLDEVDGVSFRIKVKFLLRRGREAHPSEFLKNYEFELKYN